MNSLQQTTSSPFDQIRRHDSDGEFWLARDLMAPLGYEKWERFENAIERTRLSIANSGKDPAREASRLREAVTTSANAPATLRTNFRLSRYGAYLLAMNCDPRKRAVAAAQTYFAVRTREAELACTAPSATTPLRELAYRVLEAEERAALDAATTVRAPTDTMRELQKLLINAYIAVAYVLDGQEEQAALRLSPR